MINGIHIFEDVLSPPEQMEVLDFVQTSNNWIFIPNITGKYGGNGQLNFPGNVIVKENINNDRIMRLIQKIESNVIEKLNVEFEINYRYKINWTKPLYSTYDPMHLLHIDNNNKHVVIIYYVNNATGATKIFDNSENYKSYHNGNKIDYGKFNLIEKIEPKMGRAVVFDGLFHHYADYPLEGDRYVINFNFVTKQNKKTLI